MSDDLRHALDTPPSASGVGRLHAKMGATLSRLVARLKPPMTLGVRLLATNAAGKVLLVRQSYMPGFVLPGGGVDPEETCAEAVAREAWEEARLTLPEPPKLFHVYLNRYASARDHVLLFTAQNVVQDSTPKPGFEIRETGFFAPDVVPESTTTATRARLAEVFNDLSPTDLW